MTNPLKTRRKSLGMTQDQVAARAQTTKATIMKLERGYMQLTTNWLERLATALDCRAVDLLPETTKPVIPLLGEVSNRGIVTLIAPLPLNNSASEADRHWQGLEQVEAPPETGYRHLFALRVADDSLEPFLKQGSLIYAAEPRESDFDTLLDQLALCKIENDQWIIRRIGKGYEYGRYNLISLQGSVTNDIELKTAAKIIFFKPV